MFLSRREVSDFLLRSVVIEGAACLTTAQFFSFETISCLVVQEAEEDQTLCKNTATSSLFLSAFLILWLINGMLRASAPRSMRIKLGMTKERLAAYDLTNTEKVQGGCVGFTLMCAMFLLSSLAKSAYDNRIPAVGFFRNGSANFHLVFGE